MAIFTLLWWSEKHPQYLQSMPVFIKPKPEQPRTGNGQILEIIDIFQHVIWK